MGFLRRLSLGVIAEKKDSSVIGDKIFDELSA